MIEQNASLSVTLAWLPRRVPRLRLYAFPGFLARQAKQTRGNDSNELELGGGAELRFFHGFSDSGH